MRPPAQRYRPGVTLTIADLAVVLAALMVLPALYAGFWHSGAKGSHAQLLLGGRTALTLALDEPGTFDIQGWRGDSRVEVRAGRVRFVDSPCRGKVCVHSGWLSHAGEVAACLPNGLALLVTGGERRYDAINF